MSAEHETLYGGLVEEANSRTGTDDDYILITEDKGGHRDMAYDTIYDVADAKKRIKANPDIVKWIILKRETTVSIELYEGLDDYEKMDLKNDYGII